MTPLDFDHRSVFPLCMQCTAYAVGSYACLPMLPMQCSLFLYYMEESLLCQLYCEMFPFTLCGHIFDTLLVIYALYLFYGSVYCSDLSSIRPHRFIRFMDAFKYFQSKVKPQATPVDREAVCGEIQRASCLLDDQSMALTCCTFGNLIKVGDVCLCVSSDMYHHHMMLSSDMYHHHMMLRVFVMST